MVINLKTKDLEPTPSLHEFVESKFGSLSKFLKEFEAQGVDEMTVTVARTTAHHAKGDVFEVKADLRLPKKVLRISENGSDVRVVVDVVKRKLKLEIEKYKSLNSESAKKRI
jgi:ribosomal subunit interface protein